MGVLRKFIDLYEDCRETHEEYNKLCGEIRNKYNLNSNISVCLDLSNECTKKVNALSTIKDNNLKSDVIKLIGRMEDDYKRLLRYRDINKLYQSLSLPNIDDSYKIPEEKVEELINRKYPKFSGVIKENQRKLEYEKINKMENASFEQMYIDMKSLYEAILLIQQYEQKGFIGKFFGQRKLNKEKFIDDLEELIIFYQVKVATIKNFNEKFFDDICSARRMANTCVGEIEIGSDMAIITPKTLKPKESEIIDVNITRKQQIAELIDLRQQFVKSEKDENFQKTA